MAGNERVRSAAVNLLRAMGSNNHSMMQREILALHNNNERLTASEKGVIAGLVRSDAFTDVQKEALGRIAEDVLERTD